MEPDRQPRLPEQFFDALRVLRAPLFIALLGFAALALPAQVRDLYRALAETKAWPQIATTGLLFLLAAYLTYRTGRYRALLRQDGAVEGRRLFAAVLKWGPAFYAALLLWSGALGVYLAAIQVPELGTGIDGEIDKTLQVMAAADKNLIGAAGVIAGAGLLFLLLPLGDGWRRRPSPARYAFSRLEHAIVLGLVLGMILLAFVPRLSVPLSQTVGSLAIFLVFLCALLVGLSVLQSWSDRHGVPWILLLLLWGIGLAAIDRGQAHRVRLLDSPGRGEGLVQLQYAFTQWYGARKDKDSYRGEPYPIYLVAAEAGGLYAAQFTAKVLARLQDRCPNFAQHVFAISGVSGGSLGASIFTNLAKKYADNGSWKPCGTDSDFFEKKVDEILRQDFLAPIVARGLFPDLLQRLLPSPLTIPRFSRGRAFEESIVHAWTRVEGREGNPFVRPFLSHWNPADAGSALLLNTTSVNDGRQIVISPFGPDIDDPGYHIGYLYMQDVLAGKDITLGSAVSLSGRFPWILPVATIGNGRLTLVDGAYFEGSGIETLSVLRNALRPYEVKPTGETTFPYITVHVLVVGAAQPPAPISPAGMDELTPPLRTMLNTRERRGYVAHNTMRDWDRMIECPPIRPEAALLASTADASNGAVSSGLCPFSPPLAVRLNYDDFKLPLGWALSEGIRRIIDRHSRGRCLDGNQLEDSGAGTTSGDQSIVRARAILVQNGSVASEVADQLWAGSREGPDVIRLPCD